VQQSVIRGFRHGESVELYNLAIDPSEKHNLAAEKPERVKAMQSGYGI